MNLTFYLKGTKRSLKKKALIFITGQRAKLFLDITGETAYQLWEKGGMILPPTRNPADYETICT